MNKKITLFALSLLLTLSINAQWDTETEEDYVTTTYPVSITPTGVNFLKMVRNNGTWANATFGMSYGGSEGTFRFYSKWQGVGTGKLSLNPITGYFGIGNVDPQYLLDVSGDINLTGTLYQDGTEVNLSSGIWTDEADGSFNIIDIGKHTLGSYSKAVIILHEIYDDAAIEKNYAVGTLYAFRGSESATNRTNVAQINTSSAYTQTYGTVISTAANNDSKWTLVTVTYNGTKYLAAQVPYRADFHNYSYKFMGRAYSSSECMLLIEYEDGGEVINSEIANSMEEFSPNMDEFHDVSDFIVNGNVGIGTTSPSAKLEVAEGGNILLSGEEENAGDLIFRNEDAEQLGRIWTGSQGTSLLYLSSGDNTADLKIDENGYVNVTSRLFVNGRIGIGTTAPTTALTVKGTVRASKVQIVSDDEIPASDYVFHDDYDLKSLSEVEDFVKENKHLPEVPSAAEFKENGYSVGEMDDILLRKIEELTLYIIDQQKTINSLQTEVESLKN